MKLVLTFITLVFLLGCNNYIYRDYFPLEAGNRWVYTDGEVEFPSYVEDYDTIFNYVLGGNSFFLFKNFQGVFFLKEFAKTYNGEKVSFGLYKLLYLPNPLIDGDEYNEEKRLKKYFLGDTVYFGYKSSIKVKCVGKISLEKSFSACYLVQREFIFDKDTLITNEFYAPDIGLIKIEKDGKMWVLKEWHLY